jgi:hypothetical protein
MSSLFNSERLSLMKTDTRQFTFDLCRSAKSFGGMPNVTLKRHEKSKRMQLLPAPYMPLQPELERCVQLCGMRFGCSSPGPFVWTEMEAGLYQVNKINK